MKPLKGIFIVNMLVFQRKNPLNRKHKKAAGFSGFRLSKKLRLRGAFSAPVVSEVLLRETPALPATTSLGFSNVSTSLLFSSKRNAIGIQPTAPLEISSPGPTQNRAFARF